MNPDTGLPRASLLAVLQEARALVTLPDNDFAWSGWNDEADALLEIDHYIEALESGREIGYAYLTVIFLPTGPLQELSISSGWGDEFIALANRFDAAMAQL